jgi:hypothetical protein
LENELKEKEGIIIITAIHRGPALQAQIDDYLAETIQ